jgi:hypothetical protein
MCVWQASEGRWWRHQGLASVARPSHRRCRLLRAALPLPCRTSLPEVTAGRNLQSRDIARLAALIFLHDLGKANSGFQAKRWTKEQRPRHWPLPAGHGIEALRIFDNNAFASLVEKLPIDVLSTWGNAVDPLLKASLSHHSRPIIEDFADPNPTI